MYFSGEDSSDEEMDFLRLPARSATYAPRLRCLQLEFCDQVKDGHLAELTAVARGSLEVIDYYGSIVKPRWLQVGRNTILRAILQQ